MLSTDQSGHSVTQSYLLGKLYTSSIALYFILFTPYYNLLQSAHIELLNQATLRNTKISQYGFYAVAVSSTLALLEQLPGDGWAWLQASAGGPGASVTRGHREPRFSPSHAQETSRTATASTMVRDVRDGGGPEEGLRGFHHHLH